MNSQEMFEKVYEHLFTQGERAVHMGCCRYRIDNGMTCAIGCLIPDDLYRPEMEGLTAGKILGMFPDLESTILDRHLANDLQGVHDCPTCWESSKQLHSELKAVADRYKLDIPTRLSEMKLPMEQ